MVAACGIDIVEAKRFRKSLRKNGFVSRVFTAEEVKYCSNKTRSDLHFAARWAAKEAFIKAVQDRNIRFKDIWIRNAMNGNPQICLSKRARRIVGKKKALVSISHSDSYAVAMVLIE
jgi:holo-[acyl-carrier protein] synthase